MSEINGQNRTQMERKTDKTAEWIHEIQKLESVVVRNHTEALQAAYRIGLMLIDLRKTMNAGEWEPFLAEHLSYSRQRASRYARIAKYWEEVLNSDSISEALERITEIKGRDKEGYGTARRVPDQEGRKSPAKPKKPRKPKATPAEKIALQEGKYKRQLDKTLEALEKVQSTLDNVLNRVRHAAEEDSPESMMNTLFDILKDNDIHLEF